MHRKPVRLIIRFKWNCLLGNLSHGWRKAFRACSPFCTKPFDRWHRICSSEMRIDYGLGAVEIILRWIIYRECIFTLSNSNTNKPMFMMTNQTCEFYSNVFHSMPYWQWKNQRIFRINFFPFFAVAAAVASSSLIQTIAGFMFRMTHSFTANLYGARSALQHIYFDYAHIESEHLEKHQNNEWLKSLKIYERIIGRASIYAKHSNATVVVTDIGR